MKSLAGIGAAALIATAAALWFITKPAMVTMKPAPLTASADAPVFIGR